MNNSNKLAKIFGALVLGVAIGGTLGILFAPDKGTETRKKITGKSDELTDAIKDKFNDIIEEIKKGVDSVKTRSGEFVENGKLKAEKYI